MIRTRALELQGFRAGGTWKVRLGAGVVGCVYSSNADRGQAKRESVCRWVNRHPGPLIRAGLLHGIDQSPQQSQLVGLDDIGVDNL